jgi:hypothetical protein
MTPDEALDRFHCAGWSIGEACAGCGWLDSRESLAAIV